jgi:hypothetical protein
VNPRALASPSRPSSDDSAGAAASFWGGFTKTLVAGFDRLLTGIAAANGVIRRICSVFDPHELVEISEEKSKSLHFATVLDLSTCFATTANNGEDVCSVGGEAGYGSSGSPSIAPT